MTREWTVNGDFTALRPTGVARYAREVTLALDALIAQGHPLAEGLRVRLVVPRRPEGLPLRAIAVEVVPEFRSPRLPQFWVQLQLPRHVRGGLISLCNLAPVRVRRHIVCIHDLHTRMAPASYGRLFRLAHRLVLPALGRRTAAITTVSAFSREQLVQAGIAPADAIAIAPNGADHTARWNARRARAAMPGRRPFVLGLGQRQAYKNMALLARLAPALDTLGLDLYLAGDVDPAAFQGAPASLHLLGRVDDDRLAQLFTRALCFAFPSRLEGFGLPVVEAMACGCAVIAADATALPEVCGAAALLAPPDDDAAWLAAVCRLRDEPALRAHLISAGLARAAGFSWRRSAETYLQLMARIDGFAPPRHASPGPSPAAPPVPALAP